MAGRIFLAKGQRRRRSRHVAHHRRRQRPQDPATTPANSRPGRGRPQLAPSPLQSAFPRATPYCSVTAASNYTRDILHQRTQAKRAFHGGDAQGRHGPQRRIQLRLRQGRGATMKDNFATCLTFAAAGRQQVRDELTGLL